jgi:GxxExxY protein
MPVALNIPIRRLSQAEFGEVAYEVMQHVFAIHNELGRFCDEKIYKRELARRLPNVRLEEPIDVSFGPYRARYFVDVLVGDGAVFEFKAAESLTRRHGAQLLNYLLLCDLAHGKLINVRPESVDHSFVNTQWNRTARTKFEIDASRWNAGLPGAAQLDDFLVGLLRDLGAGLDVALYEDAVSQCFGGAQQVETDVPVALGGCALGTQRMRLIAPRIAFKITTFDSAMASFETHARRLLEHTDLLGIAWANITMNHLTFTTITR